MFIKPSTSLRNDFSSIDNLATETQQPIYITKNGEGCGVYMELNAFIKREQILKLKERLLKGEEERLKGENMLSLDEMRSHLNNRAKIKEQLWNIK